MGERTTEIPQELLHHGRDLVEHATYLFSVTGGKTQEWQVKRAVVSSPFLYVEGIWRGRNL